MSVLSQIITRSQSQQLQNSNGNIFKDFEAKIGTLEKEIDKLKKQKASYQKQISALKIKCKGPVNSTSKWLSDFQISFYYDTFAQEMSKMRKDVWFFNPSATHILKLGSVFDVTRLMTSVDLNTINYAFLCVSDGNAGLESSSHWSLLVYCKPENRIFHLDSIKGYNHQAATNVIKNIGWSEETIVEVSTTQQMNSFECGLHVLVNTKHIMSYFLEKDYTRISLNDFLFHNTSELVVEKCLDGKSNNTDGICIEPSTSSFESVVKGTKSRKQNKIKNFQLECQNRFDALVNTQSSETSFEPLTQTNTKLRKRPKHIGKKQTSNSRKPYSGHIRMPKKAKTQNSNYHTTKSIIGLRKNNFEVLPALNLNSSRMLQSTRSNEVNNTKASNVTNSSDVLPKCKDDLNHSNSPETSISKQSRKHKHHNILLYADSHGRHLNNMISKSLPEGFHVSSYIKPNAKLQCIIPEPKEVSIGMTKEDVCILVGGTNDILDLSFSVETILLRLELIIVEFSKSNIIISGIPFRFDKPDLNSKIVGINKCIKELVLKYEYARYVNLNGLNRNCYTSQGLHFNGQGKNSYVTKITQLIMEKLRIYTNRIPVLTTNRTLGNKRYPPYHFNRNAFLGGTFAHKTYLPHQ